MVEHVGRRRALWVEQFRRQIMRKFLAFAVTACLGVSAYGGTYNENFTVDPGWDQLNNRVAPQNYGFSPTNITTGSGGEMGGVQRRQPSPANYYGFLLPDPLD